MSLKISKLIKIEFLLDQKEMEELLSIDDFCFYDTHRPHNKGEGIYTKKAFLDLYGEYLSALKGEIPLEQKRYLPLFSASISHSREAFAWKEVGEAREMIRQILPPIQLKPHHFYYSPQEKSIHSMVYGQESIDFGLQLSYPQLFQDPVTHNVVDVKENFPNTSLFQKMRLWIREYTLPTPFLIEGQRVVTPIRLGKKVFSWIDRHPQLNRNISIGKYTKAL